jgi:hypothetical protein
MPNLDQLLYRWILCANARTEELDLPAGLIEDSIGLLKQVLGTEYLEQLLIEDVDPIHFLDDEVNPLRKWLLSPTVDYCIIEVLELAQYFKAFRDDPSLADKVQKLTHDSFWPMLFELAMATRVKRASHATYSVSLSAETASSVGDFMISAAGYSIPCERSRLKHSPQITDPKALHEGLTHRINEGTKRVDVPLCVKIRSSILLSPCSYASTAKTKIRQRVLDSYEGIDAEYSGSGASSEVTTAQRCRSTARRRNIRRYEAVEISRAEH